MIDTGLDNLNEIRNSMKTLDELEMIVIIIIIIRIDCKWFNMS